MNAPKSLPFSAEMEEGLLSSMMLNPDLIDDECAGLNESVFYVPKCRILFGVLKRFRATSQPVEFDFVLKALEKDKLLEEIGGAEGLNATWSSVPSASNWRHYLEGVEDLYRRRTGILVCQKLIQRLSDLGSDATQSVRELVEQAFASLSLEGSKRRRSYPKILDDSLELIEQRKRERGLLGARFGLEPVDKRLGGLPPGSLTVVGAVIGGGKSALAMQAALATAKQGKACAVFSLEMPAEQIALRHLPRESEVSFGEIWKGTLEETDFEKIQAAKARLSTLPIHLEDDFNADITAILTRCRQLKAKEKIELVVVDYLQLLSGGASSREQSREREVAGISRRLRNMANELQVAVISLSQLNDEGLLRESRAIGQDADNVLIIDVPDNGNGSERTIRILKQRNGPQDLRISVKFFGQYMRYE